MRQIGLIGLRPALLMIYGGVYKSRGFSLRGFLQLFVTSFLTGPGVLLRTPLSNTSVQFFPWYGRYIVITQVYFKWILIFFSFQHLTLISGFRRDVDEICGLLGYYAASCGNYLPTFRDNVSVLSSRVKSFLLGLLTRDDGTDTLSQNVGKQLPHDVA
jgi:hypothetical protein